MKKIKLLLLIVVLGACKQSEKKQQAVNKSDSSLAKARKTELANANQAIIYKSLNGIPEDTVLKWTDYLSAHTNEDRIRIPKSLWLSKDVVSAIIKVFDSDKRIDGLRIYLGAQPAKSKRLKLSFILVATIENGPETERPYQSMKKHKDLYLDGTKYALFTLASMGGVERDGIGRRNAKLNYPGTGGVGGGGCTALPHDISVKYGEEMVAYYKIPHAINICSEWFDRSLFDVIEKSGKKDPSYSGIRIYLGQHPEHNPYYGQLDAFIISTTGGVDTTDNFDCTITKKYVAEYNKRYPNNSNKFDPFNFTPAKDNGELCPNHCN